jgi:hypothetical protein
MAWRGNKEALCALEFVKTDFCRNTKGGHIEHLQCRTETWSVSPSVDLHPFGVTIPATVPQRSELPERLINYPAFKYYVFVYVHTYVYMYVPH